MAVQKHALIGDYTLVERLGNGGFGAVWKASRPSGIVTLTYAVKILHKTQTDEKRFRAEAESWAKVSNPPHEHIVTIHFAGICEGEYLLTSDFCLNGTLEDWLKDHRPTTEQALVLMEGILHGLAHLHRHQIVHCDLKPANILLQGMCNPGVFVDSLTAADLGKKPTANGTINTRKTHHGNQKASNLYCRV